jgi:hypothetical protein
MSNWLTDFLASLLKDNIQSNKQKKPFKSYKAKKCGHVVPQNGKFIFYGQIIDFHLKDGSKGLDHCPSCMIKMKMIIACAKCGQPIKTGKEIQLIPGTEILQPMFGNEALFYQEETQEFSVVTNLAKYSLESISYVVCCRKNCIEEGRRPDGVWRGSGIIELNMSFYYNNS